MKQFWTRWTILLVLLFVVSGCGGNGRSPATLPNTTANDVDGPGGQAEILATQAAEVLADEHNELATRAAATVVAQAEALATQAAQVITEEGPVLATQAAEALENGTLPIPIEPGSLAEKFATIPLPEGGGTAEITVTEAELNEAIATAQAQSGAQSLIQNPQVRLSGGHIILTGTLGAPISGQLTVTFAPYVTNNTLQFEVVEATIGTIQVPPAALQTAEQTLNNSLGAAMSQLPAGAGLQSVTIGEATMTVVVVRL